MAYFILDYILRPIEHKKKYPAPTSLLQCARFLSRDKNVCDSTTKKSILLTSLCRALCSVSDWLIAKFAEKKEPITDATRNSRHHYEILGFRWNLGCYSSGDELSAVRGQHTCSYI